MSNRTTQFYSPWEAFYYEPLTTFDQIKTIQTQNSLLEEGGAPRLAHQTVEVGFEVFRAMFESADGVLSLPGPEENVVGDHSVGLIGYDESGDTLVFVNSWGSEWGDEGVGYMSREYFERFATDAWLIRRLGIGPRPANFDRLNASQSAEEYALNWMLPDPPWKRRIRFRRKRFQWIIYHAISASGHLVDALYLKNGYGLTIAWAFVSHYTGEDRSTSSIQELFVWPAFQRQGIGTLLEEGVLDLSRQRRARRIHLLLHEADIVASPSVKRFGELKGYRWDEVHGKRPWINSIGVKNLLP